MAAGVWTNITDILWPVGSIYECLENTVNTPSELFGGMWIKIKTHDHIGTHDYDIWYRYA